MEEKAKQRLVGILVFMGALFVILPFLFHNSRPSAEQKPLSVTDNASPALALPPVNATQTNNTLPTAVSPATPPSAVQTAVNNANAALINSKTVVAQAAPVATYAAPAMIAAVTPTPVPALPATPVAANTSEPGIVSASGLTTGESDDQPTAIQKASAASLPAVPAVKPVVATAAAPEAPAASPSIPAAPKKTAMLHATEKKPILAHEQKGAWMIQVGVFSEKKNAQHLLAALHQHHFQAYSHSVVRNGRSLLVVFVGPEKNLAQAKIAQRQLAHTVRVAGEIKQYHQA